MASIVTIKRTRVVPYRETAMCDCGGEMCSTGYRLDCLPPQHAHKCAKCGAREFLDYSYPRIDYVVEEVVDATP